MNGPSTRNRIYFHRLQAQVFRIGQSCYIISYNVSTWFNYCIGCIYFVWCFVAAVCQTLNKYWWRCCSRYHIRICNLICSNGSWSYLTVLKLQKEQISHLYDIDIFWSIVLSLTAWLCINNFTSNNQSKWNSLIFFEKNYRLFHSDWLF